MYYNARYYDPKLGRFISADTMIPDPSYNQSFNRYMYVAGNPVSFNDPSGHFSVKGLGKKITGGISGIVNRMTDGGSIPNSINPVSLIKSAGNAIKNGWNSSKDRYLTNMDFWKNLNAITVTSVLITLIPLPELFIVFLFGTVQFKEGSDWNDLNSFSELRKNTYWDWGLDGDSINEWENQCLHITGSLVFNSLIPGSGPIVGAYNEFAQYYGWEYRFGKNDHEHRKSGERERDAIFWLL